MVVGHLEWDDAMVELRRIIDVLASSENETLKVIVSFKILIKSWIVSSISIVCLFKSMVFNYRSSQQVSIAYFIVL